MPEPSTELARAHGQRKPNRPWVQFSLKVGLAMVSLGITLVLMDGFLRVTGIGAPRRGNISPKPGKHPLTAWIDVFPPGYSGTLSSRDFNVNLRMNSLGLRERELDFERIAADRPCVFLGDSYFFGWGVEAEERLSERLSTRFNQDGHGMPIVNFSFPGWGTFHCLDVWQTFLPKLKPRLVVISCFIGNDFSDDIKQVGRLDATQQAEAGAGNSAPQGTGFQLVLSIREYLSTSPLVGALQHSLWQAPGFRAVFNRLELRNDRLVLYERESSPLKQRLFDATKAAYTEIAREAKELGVPVVVVLIPDQLQVLSPELFQDLVLDNPQRKLTAALQEHGFLVVDLLPAFRDAPRRDLYFFNEDKHWTKAGHQFVTDILYPILHDRDATRTP